MNKGSERTHAVAIATSQDDRKRAVRRTALLLALVALGIYVAFILSGVMRSA